MDLHEALTKLAQGRQEQAELKEAAAKLQKALEATTEWQELQRIKAGEKEIEAEVKVADQAVRQATLEAFTATGDKHPMEGASIALFREVRYDMSALLAWCQQKRPSYVLVSVDTKRVAKNADDLIPDGAPIEIVLRPEVRLDPDLSQYVKEAEVEARLALEAEKAKAEQFAEAEGQAQYLADLAAADADAAAAAQPAF